MVPLAAAAAAAATACLLVLMLSSCALGLGSVAVGAALAPGASSFDSWPSKDLDGPLGSSSGSYGRALGGLSSDPRGDPRGERYNASRDRYNERYSERRRLIQYSKQHLEDLKDMMKFKLKMEELPLPRGLSIELLEHLYKNAADEEVRHKKLVLLSIHCMVGRYFAGAQGCGFGTAVVGRR
jgi:hypothetical protein